MTVSIPVSANASSAISEIDRIGDAIRRAGQEGRKFADLDLAHPELSGFAVTIEGVQRQLDELNRLSIGKTAADSRFATSNGSDNPFLQRELGGTMGQRYPDPVARDAALQRLNGHAFAGTSLYTAPASSAAAPNAPPPPPPRIRQPPLSRPAPVKKLGNALGGMVSKLLNNPLAQAAGIASIGSLVGSAISGGKDEAIGNDQLMRSMPGLVTDFDELRESVRKAADGMHLTYKQAQDMALTMQRQGANAGPYANAHNDQAAALDSVRVAGGLARGFGTNAGNMAQMVARSDANGVDARAFAQMLASAVAQGGMAGKSDQAGQAILSYIEATSRSMPSGGGAVEGMAEKFAGMYTSMNASNSPGLHGANASRLIGNIDQSIRAGGGGGMASTALNYRAYAANGITNPYQMLYKQEEGMFADLGHGQTNYSAQMAQINRQYAGRDPKERLNAISRHFGISMHEAEATDRLKTVDLSGTNKRLQEMGLDPSKLNPSAYADIAEVLAPHADLEAQRTKLLKSGGLTDDEKKSVGGASGEDLRTQLVKAINEHGTQKSQGQAIADLDTDLRNALTALGSRLLTPLEAIQGGVVLLAKSLEAGLEKASKTQPMGGGGGGVDQFNNPLMTPDGLLSAPSHSGDREMGPPPPPPAADGTAPNTPGGLTGGATVQKAMALLAVNGRFGRPGGMLGGGGDGGGGAAYNGRPAAALTAGKAADNAQYAYNFFRAHNYTHEQASGIVAGNIAESGMRTDADGDSHRSGGISQWNGSRRAAFAKMFGHDVRDGTLQEQLEFEQWELTHTEKNAGDAIRRSTTTAGAADAHTRLYERPRYQDRDSRTRQGIAAANERNFRERYEQGLPGEQRAPGGDTPAGDSQPGGARLYRTSYESGNHPIEFAPLRIIIEDGKGGMRSAHTVNPQQISRPSPFGQTNRPGARVLVPGGAGRTYGA